MKHIMRLTVPTNYAYTLRQLGRHVGQEFRPVQILEIPLHTDEELQAARLLQTEFENNDLHKTLMDGPNAVTVHSIEVLELRELIQRSH